MGKIDFFSFSFHLYVSMCVRHYRMKAIVQYRRNDLLMILDWFRGNFTVKILKPLVSWFSVVLSMPIINGNLFSTSIPAQQLLQPEITAISWKITFSLCV